MDKQLESFCNLTPDIMLNAIESVGYSCDGRFIALNSYENRVYQVFTHKDETIVAKFYRPERWTDAAIVEEHKYTLDLAKQEIPVIAPIISADGNTLFKSGDYRFSLSPCHGGRPPELDNKEHLQQLGRFIARIHATGANQSFEHRETLSIDNMLVSPAKYLLGNNFIPEHIELAYKTIIDEIKLKIEPIDGHTNTHKILRLHGDFHPGNVLWTDKGPHIVDFDDTKMGPAIQDLWMLLSGDKNEMSEYLGELLTGYTQFYDFDPAELRLIEVMRSLRIIHYSYWLASRWRDPAFPVAFPWFNTVRYWEEQVLSLKEQSALLDEPPVVWAQ